MRAAVVGGTGTLGCLVVERMRARGHETRVLSRTSAEFPVDLTTGKGLAEALDGCEVVVDAANSRKGDAEVLVEGTRRLLEAGKVAGVARHVCVSIVGCEGVPNSYFRVKAEQERVVEQGEVPWTIVRATQFHELVTEAFESMAKVRLLPAMRVPIQTVDSGEVAAAVADAAEKAALLDRIEIAGPEILELRDLAWTWRSITGKKALAVPVPVPGKLGRALRGGVLTNERPDVQGERSYAAWLTEKHVRG